MAIELKIPEVGESIAEVEIGGWLKRQGEQVKKDEPVLTLESEKATVELPAPESGTLAQVLKQKGETAKVGLEEANSRVYSSRVQAWAQQADVYIKQAELDYQGNKQTLDWNIANMQRAQSFTSQLLNVIQAKATAFNTETTRAAAASNAEFQASLATINVNQEQSRIAVASYQAQVAQWQTRAQQIIQSGNINVEALKTVAQVAANWLAGALAGTHVSAGISGSASAGQTSSRSSTDTTSQAKNINENDNYTIQHQYIHRT